MDWTSDVQLERYHLLKDTLHPQDSFEMELKFTNSSFDSIPKGSYGLTIQGDAFFLQKRARVDLANDIGSGHSWTWIIQFTPVQGTVNLEELPESKEIEVSDLSPKPPKSLHKFKVTFAIEPYVRGLLTLQPITILLWGYIGTGKTSFMSSALSLLHAVINNTKDVTSWGVSMAAEKSVTQHISYMIPSNEPVKGASRKLSPQCNVAFVDVWGTEENAKGIDPYPVHFVQPLLQGRIPPGFSLDELPSFLPDNDAYPVFRKITSVFMSMTPSAAASKDYMKKIQAFTKSVMAEELLPLLLVTQIDTADPQCKLDPRATTPEVTRVLEEIQRETGIGQRDMCPVVNYTDNSYLSFHLDRAIYVALKKAFLWADAKVQDPKKK